MNRAFLTILAAYLSIPATTASAHEDSWESVAPMPTARESVAACTIGDFIYAVGGFPGGSDAGMTLNERYDPATGSWTAMAPMPTGRRMPVTGTVGGRCYVIGGRRTDGPRGLDVVEEYNPATNSWSTRSSMPTARFGHSSAVLDGLIYVAGGADRAVIFGTLEAYDPAADSWTTLANMPAPRALAGMAAINGKIYVMGGTVDENQSKFARLDIYDPVTDSWSRGANMPLAKFSLASSATNGRIFAVGGADGPGAINNVAAYHPESDTWTTVSPMMTRRARFASAVAGNQVYAIGGTTSFGVPHVGMDLAERYTPAAAEPAFQINAGLNDAWFNPLTPGQGFLISVFPVIRQVFVAWFTYDTERPPEDTNAILGDPGHRWLTAQGPYSGDTASLTLFLTEGGVFDAPEPPAATQPGGYGAMTIEFADCNAGLVSYDITSPLISGQIPIERIVLDNVALCQQLNSPPE